MDWIEEVNMRLSRKNQILFAKDLQFLCDLAALFQTQSHRVIALWAFDMAEQSIGKLREKYPDERRPTEALQAARAWASGNLKMRPAQRRILDCHAFAKEIDCLEDIATCHAVGQACSVVHTVGHAMGYPMYDLTSIVYKLGIQNCTDAVLQRKQEYINKLLYWSEHLSGYSGGWAPFMFK